MLLPPTLRISPQSRNVVEHNKKKTHDITRHRTVAITAEIEGITITPLAAPENDDNNQTKPRI